jgi:hypothetical protein
MTRDQLSQLQWLATEVRQWIESGDVTEPPLLMIRQLARFATIAAAELEQHHPELRSKK